MVSPVIVSVVQTVVVSVVHTSLQIVVHTFVIIIVSANVSSRVTPFSTATIVTTHVVRVREIVVHSH